MERREFLAAGVAAGGLLAGCTSRGGSAPGESPTPTPAPDEDEENGDDGGDDEFVEVPACPERPDELTEETVGGYANRFEQAYKARRLKDQRAITGYIQFKHGGSIRSVTAEDGGFRVRLSYELAYGIEPAEDETDIDLVHADDPYAVSYFVDDESVHRIELENPYRTPSTPLDPREVGSAVACSE
jgi:hypothetical protein